MFMTAKQIFELEKIETNLKSKEMPIRTLYKFSKLFKTVAEEAVFYSTRFQEIINKYAERDADGNFVMVGDGQGIKVKPAKLNECGRELDELDNLEIELPDITFTLDELDDLKLSMEMVSLLLPFIQEQ